MTTNTSHHEQPLFTRRLKQLFRRARSQDGQEYSPSDVQVGTRGALTASYIWRLLSGSAANPSYNVIQALSEFFQVDPAYFFQKGEDDVPETLATPRKQRLMDEATKRMRRVDEESVQLVVDLLVHIETLRDNAMDAQTVGKTDL